MSDELPAPAPAPEAAPAPAPSPRDAFIAMLPEEIRSEGVFANFNGVEDLAKSYFNAAKMVGLDKGSVVAIPRDDSKEAWDGVYSKLGRPESPDKYNLDAYKDSVDMAELKPWVEKLHSLGFNQKQVDGVFGEFFGKAKEAQEKIAAEKEARYETWGAQVKAEYGMATDQRLDAAINVAEKLAGPEAVKIIADNPDVFRNPTMVKLLVSVAEKTGEGSILLPGGQKTSGPLSPADAKQQLSALQANPEYWDAVTNKAHPQHDYFVETKTKLWQFIAGDAK